MAQLAFSIAGAAVGSMFGQPQIGWMVGSLIGAAIAGKDDQGPKLSDNKAQISSYGAALGIVWGCKRKAGNIIWSTDMIAVDGESGGKGGGGGAVGQTYRVSFAVAICEGEIAGIRKIWAGGKLVYDVSSGAGGDAVKASAEFAENMALYLGTETQLPDPTIEAAEGSGSVEAYRGVAYVVFNDMLLAEYGNAMPQLSFEVLTAADAGTPTVGDWVDDRGLAPEHDAGPTLYDDLRMLSTDVSNDQIIQGSFNSLADAIDAVAAVMGPRYSNVLCWNTSDEHVPNIFSGGASLAVSDDADYCYVFIGPDPNPTVLNVSVPAWHLPFAGVEPSATTPYLIRGGFDNPPDEWKLGNGELKFVYSSAVVTPPEDYDGVLSHDTINHQPFYPYPYYPSVVVARFARIRISRVAFTPTIPDAIPLSQIVANVCERAGLGGAEVDVTELTDLVDGYEVARQMPARSALEQLRKAYYFDAVENGDVVQFVKRGGASVVTIDSDDLGAGEGNASTENVAHIRAQETELPAELNVAYSVRETDYQIGVQQSRRITTGSLQSIGEELPLVLTDEKAAEVADVLMVDAWLGRTERKFTTTRKFTTYLPTDVVTVNDGGFSYVGRITQKLENGPVIEWTMRDEASATYSPNVVPSPSGSGGVIGSVSYNGDMRLQLLDIPAAMDSHTSDAGFYASAAGYREAFRGGVLFKSADAITYNNLQTLTTSIQGQCLTALPDFAGGNVVDELSSVDVVVYAGETLSSIDRAAHMNGGNLCVIGSELLMYRSAVLIGADTYRLTGLLRGRRGTEQHIGAHALGDRFVLLDARVTRVAQNLPVGEDYYKGVAIGFALSDTVQQRFTNTAAALKPLSPAHLQAVDIGGGDYAVQWVRRGRVAANWMDGVDVPLGETSEAYAVEVSDEYDVEIISSTTVTSPSATIAASSGYIVRVYQLSATVGRGFPAVTTIA